MQKTSMEFLAKACGGRLLGDIKAFALDVKIDSRQCGPGDLFVCVIGENNDGHRFAASAFEKGCRCFLMSDPDEAEKILALSEDTCVCLADDTQKAFIKMALAYMEQFKPIKIGVTGSVGKTTTKMLTASVMSAKYNTVCTKKNYNTSLGLCLTCFLADSSTGCIVFEMGMDRSGEIRGYVDWVRPDAAIITNVGISHMEKLGSRDAIADAKLEITEKFTKDSLLVVNSLSDYLKTEEEIRSRAVNKEPFRIVLAGKDIRYENLKNTGAGGISFYIDGVRFELPLLGEHNAVDALLAVALGLNFGVDLKSAAGALGLVKPTERRMDLFTAGGITLLDDSYNASPDSMKAAISALAGIDAGRRIALLSDMRELGAAEEEGHISVGTFAAENKTDILIAVGEKKEYYLKGVSGSKTSLCDVICSESMEAASKLVLEILRPGDALLVKGSNSTGVSAVAEAVKDYLKNLS